MNQYYYSDGYQNFGPFTLEELRDKKIGPETLVWYEGLPEWKKAREVPEMATLLGASTTPPPPPASGPQPQPRPQAPGGYRPKNWLVESILVTILCCLPFGIIGIINASKVDSAFASGDIAGAEKAAAEAAKWTKIGFFVGLSVLVLYFIYIFAVVGIAAFGSGNF